MNRYAAGQPLYLERGWPSVLPLPPGKKFPPPRNYTGKTGRQPTDDEHATWLATKRRGNVALRMPYSVLGIDVDDYGAKVGGATLAEREAEWGPLPATWRSTSRPDDAVSGIRYFAVPVDREWSDVGKDVETVWWGHRYAVVWPSTHPDTGAEYLWLAPDGSPSEPPKPSELPALPEQWVTGLTRTRPERRKASASAAPSVRVAKWAARALEDELARVQAATEGDRDKAINTAAFNLGQMVGGGFLDESVVTAELTAAGLATGQDEALVNKAVAHGIGDGKRNPRRGPADVSPDADEVSLDDSPLAAWTASRLSDRFCWAGGRGWLEYTGKVWADATDATITEAVRTEFRDLNKREIDQCTDVQRLKRLPDLLRAGKIRAVVGLMRGILEVSPSGFDQHPDLLNVANGVVDLRTGELLPHRPGLLLTKISPIKFRPGASHADWQTALDAVEPEVADWLQVRFGQAATGHVTTDAAQMPVLQGTGQNGKSTIVTAIMHALGEHALMVSPRVLLSNPGDHPTELTTLRGARVAFMEEAPEGRHLSVKRLKDLVGTSHITARRIRENDQTWAVTHTLFMTTNYRLVINETDHGTWRRLLLVPFPYTYRRKGEPLRGPNDRQGDPGLLDRFKGNRQGQLEAVLAWVIEGAKRWYDADRVLPQEPEAVTAATAEWRAEADLIYAYVRERLAFDPNRSIQATVLYSDFCEWREDRGHPQPWSDQTFSARFGDHDTVARHRVTKARTRSYGTLSGSRPAGSGPQTVWRGVRFQTAKDDPAQEPLVGP